MVDNYDVAFASIPITPDIDTFIAELQPGIDGAMATVKTPTVGIGATMLGLQSKIAQASAELLALTQQVYNANLGANTAPFLEKLAALKAEVDGLTLSISTSADITKALADIQAVKIAADNAQTGSLLDALATGTLAGAASGGGGAAGGGILSMLGWGGGQGIFGMLGGMAAFGSLLSFMGFGAEHVLATGVGTAGSLLGAGVGGGLLGLGGLGVTGVGMGTDLAGIGQATGDISNVYKALTQVSEAQRKVTTYQNLLNLAIAQFGKTSTQAKTAATNLASAETALTAAQAGLNTVLQSFSPKARTAVLAAAKYATQLHWLFDTLTGEAESKGAQIITAVLHAGTDFLPVIGKFATENMTTIMQDMQPLLTWLDTTGRWGGLGIFTNLEDIFQRGLPTAIKALTTGIELFAKVIDTAAQYTGPFLTMLVTFLHKWNTTTFSVLSHTIGDLITSFRTWLTFFKQFFVTIMDIFKPAVGLGDALATLLSRIFQQIQKWLTSSEGSDLLHQLFTAHLVEVITAIGGLLIAILPAAEDIADAFLNISTMGALLVTEALKPIIAFLTILFSNPVVNTLIAWGAAFFFIYNIINSNLIPAFESLMDRLVIWLAGGQQLSQLDLQFNALSSDMQEQATATSVGVQQAFAQMGIGVSGTFDGMAGSASGAMSTITGATAPATGAVSTLSDDVTAAKGLFDELGGQIASVSGQMADLAGAAGTAGEDVQLDAQNMISAITRVSNALALGTLTWTKYGGLGDEAISTLQADIDSLIAAFGELDLATDTWGADMVEQLLTAQAELAALKASLAGLTAESAVAGGTSTLAGAGEDLGAGGLLGPAGLIAGGVLAVGGLAMAFLGLTSGAKAAARAVQQAVTQINLYVKQLPKTSVTQFTQDLIYLTHRLQTAKAKLNAAVPGTTAWTVAWAKVKSYTGAIQAVMNQESVWGANVGTLNQATGASVTTIEQLATKLKITLTHAMTVNVLKNFIKTLIVTTQTFAAKFHAMGITVTQFATELYTKLHLNTQKGLADVTHFAATVIKDMEFLNAYMSKTKTAALSTLVDDWNGNLAEVETIGHRLGVTIPSTITANIKKYLGKDGLVTMTGIAFSIQQAENSTNDGFKNITGGVHHALTTIKHTMYFTGEAAVTAFDTALSSDKIPTTLKDQLAKLIQEIAKNKTDFKTGGVGLITMLQNGIASGTTNLISTVTGIVQTQVNIARSFHQAFYNAGTYLGTGFAGGIVYSETKAIQAADQLANRTIGAALAAAAGSSPSRKMIQQGKWLVEGYVIGITGTTQSAIEAAGAMVNKTITAAATTAGSASPSTKMITQGMNFVQGFATGIETYSHLAVEAAHRMVNGTLTALDNKTLRAVVGSYIAGGYTQLGPAGNIQTSPVYFNPTYHVTITAGDVTTVKKQFAAMMQQHDVALLGLLKQRGT